MCNNQFTADNIFTNATSATISIQGTIKNTSETAQISSLSFLN